MSCTVIGLGISNRPLIEFLLSHGACVSARDGKTREALGAYADEMEARGVRLYTGKSYLDGICEELIFRTPGVRPDLPEIASAVERGSILTSEMELFFALTPARIIAVTGSDGKTTTTTLTHLLLSAGMERRGGKVYVGGNIGEPLLPRVEQMTDRDIAVVELSSFQLMTMQKSAHVAAITNLSPNHLNWHTDMAEYVSAKINIYNHLDNMRAVFNVDNAESLPLIHKYGKNKTLFSSTRREYSAFAPLLKRGDRAVYEREGVIYLSDGECERAMLQISDILLPGRHNLENYMTAIALTDGLVTVDEIRTVATTFHGVEHRLERVRTVDGVTYYNSSIDSSPSRTAAALSALAEKPIVICGGCDKGIPFDGLALTLSSRAKAIVLTGQTAEVIEKELVAADCPVPIYRTPLFDDAVRLARDVARVGDTVLLSPACTSFDAFANFMERGNRFKDIVNRF